VPRHGSIYLESQSLRRLSLGGWRLYMSCSGQVWQALCIPYPVLPRPTSEFSCSCGKPFPAHWLLLPSSACFSVWALTVSSWELAEPCTGAMGSQRSMPRNNPQQQRDSRRLMPSLTACNKTTLMHLPHSWAPIAPGSNLLINAPFLMWPVLFSPPYVCFLGSPPR
jgi:hypothetical protein